MSSRAARAVSVELCAIDWLSQSGQRSSELTDRTRSAWDGLPPLGQATIASVTTTTAASATHATARRLTAAPAPLPRAARGWPRWTAEARPGDHTVGRDRIGLGLAARPELQRCAR